jgi:hypothetical protein
VSVHGPDGGYDFGNKRQYHRTVWNAIEARLVGIPKAERHVVILESQEGGEARFLLDRGYRADQIHAVNRSAAVIATMTRSLRSDGYRDVDTHGGDVTAVLARLRDRHPIHAINLDLCSNASWATIQWLRQSTTVLDTLDNVVLGVTLMRGREGPHFRVWQEAFRKQVAADELGDFVRLYMVTRTLGGGMTPEGIAVCARHLERPMIGRYWSPAAGQSMLWFVTRHRPHGANQEADHLWWLRSLWRRLGRGRRTLEDAFRPWCLWGVQERWQWTWDEYLLGVLDQVRLEQDGLTLDLRESVAGADAFAREYFAQRGETRLVQWMDRHPPSTAHPELRAQLVAKMDEGAEADRAWIQQDTLARMARGEFIGPSNYFKEDHEPAIVLMIASELFACGRREASAAFLDRLPRDFRRDWEEAAQRGHLPRTYYESAETLGVDRHHDPGRPRRARAVVRETTTSPRRGDDHDRRDARDPRRRHHPASVSISDGPCGDGGGAGRDRG